MGWEVAGGGGGGQRVCACLKERFHNCAKRIIKTHVSLFLQEFTCQCRRL